MAENQNASKNIMLITALVAIVLTVIAWPLAMLGKNWQNSADDDNAEVRIQPIAKIEMRTDGAKSDGTPRSGETVFNTVCKACHDAGLLGAPKPTDKAAWAPRLATGNAALMNSILKGKNSMPARGGSSDLSDEELSSALDYLIQLAK